mmetsp:Transcript_7120/g.18478  ORF Transcript_7120/g.18478 Transcript_7120/m.18478 type:complete len:215 (+) Transcript_7120:1842-2486(+)
MIRVMWQQRADAPRRPSVRGARADARRGWHRRHASHRACHRSARRTPAGSPAVVADCRPPDRAPPRARCRSVHRHRRRRRASRVRRGGRGSPRRHDGVLARAMFAGAPHRTRRASPRRSRTPPHTPQLAHQRVARAPRPAARRRRCPAAGRRRWVGAAGTWSSAPATPCPGTWLAPAPGSAHGSSLGRDGRQRVRLGRVCRADGARRERTPRHG